MTTRILQGIQFRSNDGIPISFKVTSSNFLTKDHVNGLKAGLETGTFIGLLQSGSTNGGISGLGGEPDIFDLSWPGGSAPVLRTWDDNGEIEQLFRLGGDAYPAGTFDSLESALAFRQSAVLAPPSAGSEAVYLFADIPFASTTEDDLLFFHILIPSNTMFAFSTLVETGAGNDTIHGTTANETISGGPGDDLILSDRSSVVIGGPGNDRITGTGIETVIFDGRLADAVFGSDGQNVIVTTRSDFDGSIDVDTVSNVHFLQFSDETITLASALAEFLGNGTEGDDTLIGTFEADLIRGNGGNDLIRDRGNDDTLAGGAGDDTIEVGIEAASGKALIFSGLGNDRIKSNVESIIVLAGASNFVETKGNVTVVGGDGDDRIHVDLSGSGPLTGPLVAYGRGGEDFLFSPSGNSFLAGGAGNDTIISWGPNDTIYGGYGDNQIDNRNGDVLIVLSTGNDTVGTGHGDDTVYAGSGDDIIDARTRTVLSVEDIGENRLFGENGNDTIFGGGLADFIGGGADDDFIGGGAGDDEIYGGLGDDTIYGGVGDDVLIGGEGRDLFVFVADGIVKGAPDLDYIYDFTAGEDLIDLRTFNTKFNANSEFSANGAASFYIDDAGDLVGTVGGDEPSIDWRIELYNYSDFNEADVIL
jgi:Ca2+-binding RTX toxin-like protein